MIVFAHRGLHKEAPENTLAAFQAAAELGVHGIETDLRVSSAGEIVLFHDRNVACAATGELRPVESLTREELSAACGYDVPVLSEAISAWPDLTWNLEIKDAKRLPEIFAAVAPFGATHRLLLTSFWHPAAMKAPIGPGVEAGILLAHRPMDRATFLATLFASRPVRTIVWHHDWVDESIVEAAARRGVRTIVYGCETKDEHETWRRSAVEGVITDFPELALEDAASENGEESNGKTNGRPPRLSEGGASSLSA